MRFTCIVIVLLLLTSLVFVFIENRVRPVVKEIALSTINLEATEIINKVIYNKMLEKIEYSDLINIHKDSKDKITFIQADTIKINKLMSKVNIEVKKELANFSKQKIEIPLGQVLGSQLFANLGPKIKITVIPAGEMDVELLQDFYEAGINQTRHILYLDVKTSVKIVVPLIYEKEVVSVQAPIAETIIVGSVPSTIVKVEGVEDLLKSSLYSGLEK